ncbi:3545_t:CDS:2, partial [Dentiscutata erythropus]
NKEPPFEKKVKCSYKWCELYEAKRYGHTSHNSYEFQEEEGWGLPSKNPPFP